MSRSSVTKLKQVVQTVLRGTQVSSAPSRPRDGLLHGQRFRVGFERPGAFETCGERIEIRGWAISLDGIPVEAEAIINGHTVPPIEFNQVRTDVAKAFARKADSNCRGFSLDIPWDDIEPGLTQAEILLCFSHADEYQVLGPTVVYRASQRAEPRFLFRLERPANDEVVAGAIEVRGWALSLDGQDLSGSIYIDNELVAPLCFDRHRLDVCAVHDVADASCKPGFTQRIDWSALGEEITQANIEIELNHGADQVRLGPLTVSRSEAPLLRHQRGSYKEVWNGAASDSVCAFTSVAATSDPDDLLDSGLSTSITLREAIEIKQSDVVLEVGCGIGRIGKFLAPDCQRWIGSDISGEMLEHAKEYLQGVPNVEFVELQSCELPEFADESVDKVYCSTVFMHLDEWDRFRYVREAFRILRPGGRLYVDNLNLAGEIGWSVFEEGTEVDAAQRSAAISKLSTSEELVTYFLRAGFEKVTPRPGPHYVAVSGKKPLG